MDDHVVCYLDNGLCPMIREDTGDNTILTKIFDIVDTLDSVLSLGALSAAKEMAGNCFHDSVVYYENKVVSVVKNTLNNTIP